jgi:hypothetical protein
VRQDRLKAPERANVFRIALYIHVCAGGSKWARTVRDHELSPFGRDLRSVPELGDDCTRAGMARIVVVPRVGLDDDDLRDVPADD